MSTFVYVLTGLTGRHRNTDRRIVVGGFDFRRRTVIVTAVAVAISIPLGMLLSAFVGPMGFIIAPAVSIAAAFVLFETRSRRGLQVQLYRSLLDQRRANINEFFVCWRPVGSTLGEANIVASSQPVEKPIVQPKAVYSEPSRRELRGNSVESLLESIE